MMKLVHFFIFFLSICICCLYILSKFKIKNNKFFLISYIFFALSIFIFYIYHNALFILILYLILFYIIFDLTYIFLKIFKFVNKINRCFFIFLPLILSIMMTVYGIYNAYDIKDHYYNIDIDKEIGESINLVFISDVHVGTSIDYKALSSLVDKVNCASLNELNLFISSLNRLFVCIILYLLFRLSK